jgi:hypothetical protein
VTDTGQLPNAQPQSPAFGRYLLARLQHSSFFTLVQSAVFLFIELELLEPRVALPPEYQLGVRDTLRDWKSFQRALSAADYKLLCNQLWHCRNMDALQQYLVSMLLQVFLQRPETLRSSETLRVSDVLTCSNLDEVVRLLAQRKVDALGYQGLEDLMSYLGSNLGLPLHLDDAVLARLQEAMEVRNIIIHNSGVVNAIFLRRTRRSDLRDGEQFPLDQDYVLQVARACEESVRQLDTAFCTHFGLTFRPEDYGPHGTAAGNGHGSARGVGDWLIGR